jgi:hypothetical protein
MPWEAKPNRGVLWRNNKHVDGDKLPSLKGEGLLELPDGSMVTVDIAAWENETPRAGKFLALSIRVR